MLIALFTCFMACASHQYSNTDTAKVTKPNIVFILADDLGYGDLSSYGHEFIRTPHIDSLAKRGMKFTNFYSASPLCSPSRAAILTGRTPYRTGIRSWIPQGQDIYLRPEELSLASLLKRNGYQTYMSGKWHLNGGLDNKTQSQPQDHGFEQWMALHAFALPNHKNPVNFYEDGLPLGKMEGFTADIVIDKAISYLDNKDNNKPYFLYVPMVEPHSEIASPDDFNAQYSEHTTGEIRLDSLSDRGPGEYYANITYMDHQIGRLLHKIDQLDEADNTIIIFMSDNGPVTDEWRHWYEVNMYGSTGGLRGRKADLYEGGMRVPFIISYPDHIKEATLNESILSGYDILPTLCTMVDIPIPSDREIDGFDFSPTLFGNAFERPQPLFWAFDTRPDDNPYGYHYAVRSGPWKFLTDKTFSKSLLYHLEKDPQEVRDLSQSEGGISQELMDFCKSKVNNIDQDALNPHPITTDQHELTILYTNDIESVYDPIDAYWIDSINQIGGMAQLATLINENRQQAELSFLFDAGDIFTGALSKESQGKLPFDIYSAMGYDAMAIGNHEFEYGWESLIHSKQRARFPVLNANIFYEATDIPYARDYTILEKDGLRIGIIGVMGVEAFHNTIFKGHRHGLEVRDPIPIVQSLVNDLENHVDLTVVLTHQNKSAPMQSDKEVDPEVQRGFDEDYAMAGAVIGIDILLGGHSDHGLWEPVKHPITGTLIGITFGQGKQLGYMKLNIDKQTKTVTLLDGHLKTVNADHLNPDPHIKSLIESERSAHPHLSQVICQNEVTGFRKYYRESNLGNLLADVFKEESGADIGLVNPGSIRADLDKGPVLLEEIVNIYPFIDDIKVVEITGAELISLLEYSLSLNYGLAQLSGVELSYDSKQLSGNRIVSATVNGQSIDPSNMYSLACSDFIASGGDGYHMLGDDKITDQTFHSIKDHLINYFSKTEVIDMPALGRQHDIQLRSE